MPIMAMTENLILNPWLQAREALSDTSQGTSIFIGCLRIGGST
ncbi:hypothetical protein EV132_10862 [Rhizobium sullae]|uniref:Uncharacterized protein n=1 Tax=Rhizobium sullae TaxID=50338 RepID=A0A4R3Q2R0_RHISU|nr:hypothetical protein EV132_10862 [Rhizobium sullae]